MKRFSKRVRCASCGKTHYAQHTGPNRYYATCPRCGMEILLETAGRWPKETVMKLGKELAQ